MSISYKMSNGDNTSFHTSGTYPHNRLSATYSDRPQLGCTTKMERFSKGCDKVIELGRKAKAENARNAFVQTEKLRHEQLQDTTQEAKRMMYAAHLRQTDNKTKSDQYGAQMLLAMQEYVKSGIEAEYKADILAKCAANENLYLAQWKDYKMKQIHQQLTADLRPVVEAELARDSAARVDHRVRLELKDELREEVIDSLKAEHTMEVQDFLYAHLKDAVIAELRRDNEAVVIQSLRSELHEKVQSEMREQMLATPGHMENLHEDVRQEPTLNGVASPHQGSQGQSSRSPSNERDDRVCDESTQPRGPSPAGTVNEGGNQTNALSNLEFDSSSNFMGDFTSKDEVKEADFAITISVPSVAPELEGLHTDCTLNGPVVGAHLLEDQYCESQISSTQHVTGTFESEEGFAKPASALNSSVPYDGDRSETANEKYASGYESGDEETDNEDRIDTLDGTVIKPYRGDHAEIHGSFHGQLSPTNGSPNSMSSGRKRSLSDVGEMDEELNQSAKRLRDGAYADQLSDQEAELSRSYQYDMAVKVELEDSQQGLVQDAQIDPGAIHLDEDLSDEEDRSESESYDEEACDEDNYQEGELQGVGEFEGERVSDGEGDYDEDDYEDGYEEEEDPHISGAFEDGYGLSEEDVEDGGDSSASRAADTVIRNTNTQDTAWNIDDSDDEQDQTLVEDAGFVPVDEGKINSYDGPKGEEGMVVA